jgi:drug/metabolite transporter (DMT)-like permease
MIWIIFPVLAALFYSLANFSDNFIIDTAMKRRNPAALQLTYVIAGVVTLTILVAFFGPGVLGHTTVASTFALVAAGAVSVLAAIPWYHAMRHDDTFDITLFSQSSPLIALVFGAVFLGDQITGNQSLAFILIMAAIAIIIISTRSPHGTNRINLQSALLVGGACLVWVAVDVIFLDAVDGATTTSASFASNFAWLTIGTILGNLLLAVTHRRWLYELRTSLGGNHIKNSIFVVASNFATAFGGIFFRVGLVAAPTLGIMSITANVSQLFATFLLGILLTALWPKFGREQLSRRIVLSHLVALLLAGTGILLLST